VATARPSRLATRLPILLACVVLVLATVLTLVRAHTASDGLGHLDGTVFGPLGLNVDPPDPSAAALRDEAVVQAIDGVPVDEMLRGRRPGGAAQVGAVHRYRTYDGERVRDVDVTLIEPRVGRALGGIAGFLWFITSIVAVAGYTFARRPHEPAAAALVTFAACLLGAAVLAVTAVEPADLAFRPVLWWSALAASGLAFTAYLGGLAHLCLEFPRPPAWFERRRWLVPLLYLGPFAVGVVLVTRTAASGATTESLASATDAPALLGLAFVAVGVGNIVANLVRSRRDRATRRDLSLVGIALVVSVVGFVGVNTVSSLSDLDPPDWVHLGMFLPLPFAIALAVLRRGLFDLDVIVTRTIAYALTSAALVVLYVAGVAGLQSAFRASELTAAAPVAAAVALVFAPLRLGLQRLLERSMFGRRDDPYAVLADVGRSLQASGAPLAALERSATAVQRALRLPWVAVRLDGDVEPAAEAGRRPEEVVEVPIVHRESVVGVLQVGRRSPGEPFTAGELRLLEDVAAQASVAVDALRLTDALARSRARAVTSAEDERQRVRNDLHDGLGPALTGVSLQLTAALDRLDPGHPAFSAVQRASTAVVAAKADVRRLIDGMAPPQLERLGLLAALRALGDQLNADPAVGTRGHPRIDVTGPQALPILPEVEVAAYRIAAEAALNARRHADATSCRVAVSLTGGALVLEITDDGVGLREDTEPGVGLSSMRARAEGLGGTLDLETSDPGSVVRVTIPVQTSQD